MTATDNIDKKAQTLREAFWIKAKGHSDPCYVFPCLIRLANPGASLPQGIQPDSRFSDLATARLTYDQLKQVADSPDVLSFTVN